jgi:hypothetical protein
MERWRNTYVQVIGKCAILNADMLDPQLSEQCLVQVPYLPKSGLSIGAFALDQVSHRLTDAEEIEVCSPLLHR